MSDDEFATEVKELLHAHTDLDAPQIQYLTEKIQKIHARALSDIKDLDRSAEFTRSKLN